MRKRSATIAAVQLLPALLLLTSGLAMAKHYETRSNEVKATPSTRRPEATAMTKGEVSLAISGKGTGFDVGVSFGKFTITKR